MSLEHLKEIIDKSEAVTNYREVKEENAELRSRVTTLQVQLRKSQEEVTDLESLKTRFAGQEITLEEFEQKMGEHTRKAYNEEIKRKAEEKFEAEASTLTTNELNRLLNLPNEKKPPMLKMLLDKAVNVEVNRILGTEELWPPWFKQSVDKNIDDEVNKRLNDIYWANVQEGVRKAKDEEWNPYLLKYMQETITPYCKTIFLNKFIQAAIDQSFNVTCTKCGTVIAFSLSQVNVACLFNGNFIYLDCGNPQCRGFFFHTRIPFSLGDLITQFIEKPSMP